MESRTNDFYIGGLISIANKALEARFNAYFPFEEFPELRPIHAPVFQYLPLEGCRLTELGEQLNMTRQAVSYLVDYLVEHGYLQKTTDPTDSRAQIIQRTERGWAFMKRVKPLAQELQEDWARQFGEERMSQLVSLMKQLVNEVLDINYAGSVSQEMDRLLANKKGDS